MSVDFKIRCVDSLGRIVPCTGKHGSICNHMQQAVTPFVLANGQYEVSAPLQVVDYVRGLEASHEKMFSILTSGQKAEYRRWLHNKEQKK